MISKFKKFFRFIFGNRFFKQKEIPFCNDHTSIKIEDGVRFFCNKCGLFVVCKKECCEK